MQVVLLVALVAMPARSDWPTPGWVDAIAFVFWEESRLSARYPGYAEYAATTPRFVPRPRRGR